MSDNMELIRLLKEGIGQYAPGFDDAMAEKLIKYMEMLKEWNQRINLTAIEDEREMVIKHFIDSASILPFLKDESLELIDVGTGAGFPGIPVKIVYETVNVPLLDSLEKRIKFLNEVIASLNLKGIRAIHGRAEDKGRDAELREAFDVAVARAVANLPVLLEYCLPFVRAGGICIAMKGSNIEEVKASGKALDVLGGAIEEIREITLPFSDIKRHIIVIKKVRQTPTKYPRKAGKPSKDPIQ